MVRKAYVNHRRKTLLSIFLFYLLVLAGAIVVFAGRPNYGEPIELDGTEAAADPSIIRVEEFYYLYPTTDSNTIECWSSEDMIDWLYEGAVWGPPEPGAWNDSWVVAPDVLPYEGRYYLYYAAGKKIGHIGVAVSDSPTGPFIDVYDHPFIGGGHADTLLYSIDAHVFLDDDGSLYMYCTSLSPFSSVRVSPMIDPVTVTAQWTVLLRPALINWEWILCEAPWMVKHDGTYYLMYSGNGATVPEYAIGYATADHPLGPFKKFSGNPILDVDWEYDFWGPGHNSVVTDADGARWMFYHTKIAPEEGWDRVLRRNRIDFRSNKTLYVDLDDDSDDDADDDQSDDDTADDDDFNTDADDDDDGCK